MKMKRILSKCCLFLVGVSVFMLPASVNAQDTPEQLTMYWDVSSSMSERNLLAEIDYLDTYFKEHSNVQVTLKEFSNTVVHIEEYEVSAGQWDALKNQLENVVYDGASNGALVVLDKPNHSYILSTDGFFTTAMSPSVENPLLTVINSTTTLNMTLLSSLVNEDQAALISIGNAYVPKELNKGSDRVDSATENPLGLEEVIIEGDKEEVPETITTAYGEQNKDAVGYKVDEITDKDITVVNTDVSTAIQGQFSGVTLNRNADLSRIKMRTVQTISQNQYALVVIDGIPQQQANSASDTGNESASITNRIFGFINPDEIEKIAVLKSMAATNKYGSLGVNGVIEITTNRSTGKARTKKPRRIGTTATYSGTTAAVKKLSDQPYIMSFQNTTSLEEAYQVYQNLKNTYGDTPSYYLNAADYFEGWNTPEITNRIRSNVVELFPKDAVALRALAYSYDKAQMYEHSKNIYKKVREIRPKEVRSYRDLAIALQYAGDTDEAFEVYHNFFDRNEFLMNAGGLKETFEKEYTHFVNLNASKIPVAKVSPQFKRNPPALDCRILIEWNDPEAQFNINIINPQNRFFTWEHTQLATAARIASERSQGFASEEFFLTAQDKGNWRFNVIYKGHLDAANKEPIFVKFTKYRNYGTPKETREVKVVRLDKLEEELTALTINI